MERRKGCTQASFQFVNFRKRCPSWWRWPLPAKKPIIIRTGLMYGTGSISSYLPTLPATRSPIKIGSCQGNWKYMNEEKLNPMLKRKVWAILPFSWFVFVHRLNRKVLYWQVWNVISPSKKILPWSDRHIEGDSWSNTSARPLQVALTKHRDDIRCKGK